MAEKFLLKDALFNPRTVAQLGSEFAAAVPGFDATRFEQEALAGFAERELMARLEWLADCLEPQLAPDFPTFADQVTAALPPRLDPALRDDDFGHFIHAVPGILAVRHGLQDHRDRALDLIHAATQRFSMEFYIRPFLNRWPDETLARLALWAKDGNYHVRRLVSEGTRPRLPWARSVDLTVGQTMPLLDSLHGDPTRFVTRSVSNHLNDIAKFDPDLVVGRLASWAKTGDQNAKELAWMTRHSLRTLIKQGHPGALAHLGYRSDVAVKADVAVQADRIKLGDPVCFDVTLHAEEDLPVIVDYRIRFARPGGKTAEKVFKLKATALKAGVALSLSKVHKLKADATTFQMHPGAHGIVVQVNGVDVAEAAFEVLAG